MPTALTSDPLIASLPLKSGKPKLGPVLLESKLGQGGLGAVYLGYHTGLDMPVAVKVLPKKRLAELPGTLARFVREVRASARCRHPSVVGVFGYDESEELHYVILEYVAGVILAQQINAAPLLEARALDILIPIAEGLAEIWRNGLLHRDIKPENIIVPTDGPAKLLDLGLVGRDRLDLKGQIVGTPQYMSPEAARDDVDIGIQADMWSFGATLYHAVTGKQPFEADDAMACRQRVLNDEPPPPSAVNANVSGPVSRLILKLLSKKPEDRFASSAEFLRALRVVREQITSGPGIEETQVRVGSGERPAGSSTRGAGAGDVIGNCRLLQQVGAGAFGVVFKAHHALLDVDLAVKLLPLDLAEKDRIYIDLFLREARTAARIHHPNVVSIFEAGNHDGQYYLVMEYVPGGTVADRMAAHGGRLPADEVEQVLLSVARGLAAAAELNIIHR
ncbi:MAG: serine/threonine-protein kinase, partial [Planctomycetota bacterium]|nr:serine/threonine-protein kinase [Planctomycetota bacterium]